MNKSHVIPPSGLTRREALGGIAGMAAASTLAGAFAARAQEYVGRQIVMSSFGGQWEEAQRASFMKSFAERTGAEVVTTPYDFTRLLTMVGSGETPEWDIAGISADEFYAALREGVMQKLDTSIVDASHVDPRFVNEYGVSAGLFTWVLGYNTDVYAPGEQPMTWADLFDLERFPGMRTIGDRVNPMLEIALLADGVAVEDLYPLDVDRAFAKLDSIKQNIILWGTHAQALQLVGSGEAPLGLMSSTRVFGGRQDGVPVAASWHQNVVSSGFTTVVTGSRNTELAWILIDEMTKAENQAIMAQRIGLSPTNPSTFDLLDPELVAQLPTSPENSATAWDIDVDYWEENLIALQDRWLHWRLS